VAEVILYAFENFRRGVLSNMKLEERTKLKMTTEGVKDVAQPQLNTLLSAFGRWLRSKATVLHAFQNVFVY
jgi:hypothetical protein